MRPAAQVLRAIFTLLVYTLSVACREDPFPDRHLVQLGGGETLEILELDMNSGRCTMWYVSDVSLSEPDEVKSRADEIVEFWAGQAIAASCTSIALNATALRANGTWVAMEITAEPADDGQWHIQ